MVCNNRKRLYPPAPLLNRVAVEDVVLGGYQIPKNVLFRFMNLTYLMTDPNSYQPLEHSQKPKVLDRTRQFLSRTVFKRFTTTRIFLLAIFRRPKVAVSVAGLTYAQGMPRKGFCNDGSQASNIDGPKSVYCIGCP
jgi:hypothetical protein